MQGKIFLTYHDRFEMIQNELLQPIQVGESIKRIDLGILKDNEGINISEKNYKYSEFSAIYYMWKNLDLDFYGLGHYRRLFMFKNEVNFEMDDLGRHHVMRFNDRYEEFGLTIDDVSQILQDYDILIPEFMTFATNLFTQYYYSKDHHTEHLLKAFEIVSNKYPEYNLYVKEVLNGNVGIFTNIFVMKKQAFYDYCEWIFPILEEVDSFFQFEGENWYEKRYLGYIAERLNTLYFIKILNEEKVKIKTMKQVFITDFNVKFNALQKKIEKKKVYIVGRGLYTNEVVKYLQYENLNIEGIINLNSVNNDNLLASIYEKEEENHIIIASANYKKTQEILMSQGFNHENISVITIERRNPLLLNIL